MPKQVRIDIPLVALRKRHGRMSQDRLAELTGISQRTLSALETGKQQRIDLVTIARLCDVFDVDPGELFEVNQVASGEAANDDQRLQQAITALEQEGVPVFRSKSDVERVTRARAPQALADLKAGKTKGLADILAKGKRATGK